MSGELKRYGIRRASGDRYSAEFTRQAFRANQIAYVPCERSKSEIYIETLPLICGGRIELLDDPLMIDQFANLERKVRAGGRDIVDHPRGGHDDLSNVVAGVAESLAKSRRVVGALGGGDTVGMRRALVNQLLHKQSNLDRSFA